MSLTQIGNQYYYGTNNRFRALDAFGLLTNTFKNRFKQGIVKQLPPGYLYNTITRRFYKDIPKVRERFKNLENISGVLQPATIMTMILVKLTTERFYNGIIHLNKG